VLAGLRASLVAVAAVLTLAMAPDAHAHAVLQESEPANDAVIATSPDTVRVRFDEPVVAVAGAVRVFDADGGRVDDGRLSRPSASEVAVGLKGGLAHGTYTVSWRVVSADTHPVFGAFVFHVGEPGANPQGIVSEVLDQAKTPKSVSVLFTAIRFLAFALLFGCVGGTIALALVLPAREARVSATLYRLMAYCSLGLGVVSLYGIGLQGASSEGLGLGDTVRWGVVEPVVHTRFGQVWLARAGVCGLLALLAIALARYRRPRWLLDVALVLCVGLILSPTAAGHANVGGVGAFVADVVHVQAGAIWTGGLAFVVAALLLAGERRWQLATTMVPRFSSLALLSVAALLVAGAINAWLEIRSWRGLWETTYGRLVLAKIALILPLLGLGFYNKRRAVPRLRQGIASLVERRRFLAAVSGELALVVAVLAVTAVLVAEPPAKAALSPSGPFSTTAELGPLELNLVVDPANAGPNAVHLYLLSPTSGQPVDVAEVRLLASLPSGGIGPLRLQAKRLAPGHYVINTVPLTQPGNWQLRVEARKGEFDLYVQTVTVPIRKDT
jgi:copper transport protein